METAQYDVVQTHVMRMEKDRDLLGQLTDYCNEHEIDAATVTAIGAVQNATLGYYYQDEQEYEEHTVDEPMELLQASGNVSYLDGERFVHLHATFSTEDETVHAGHVFEGTKVFAGEATIQELDGPPLKRYDDEPTGLTLWEFQ
ncbi:MAG: PPC domain-containing DNA-binding protein [bacterium]